MKKILLFLVASFSAAAIFAAPPATYRQPDLYFLGVSSVAVKNNTGTANQTMLCFPDGQCRSVTEDVASTNKYRALVMTATATWITGTEDSGLMYSMPEAATTTYCVYGVKSRINASKFILAGSTWAPVQSNYSVLNSTFGKNGWVFLGMFLNGDNAGAPSDILSFVQSGAVTLLTNNATGVNVVRTSGRLLATTASAVSLTYTYSSGMVGTAIPPNVSIAFIFAGATGDTSGFAAGTSRTTKVRWRHNDAVANTFASAAWTHVADGFTIGDATGGKYDFLFAGWIDDALR